MTQANDNNHYLPLEEETIDFKKLFFQILGNWYWFAITLFASLFVAYLVNRYSEPVYSVKASLLIEGADGRKYGPGVQMLMREMNLNSSSKRIENEIGILKSYRMAYKTIEELKDFHIAYIAVGRREIKESKLYNRAPFRVYFDTSQRIPYGVPFYITYVTPERFRLEVNFGVDVSKEHTIGEVISIGEYSFVIKQKENLQDAQELVGKKYYFIPNSLNTLARMYQNKLKVELNNDKGSILNLSSVGFVSEQEADYLNKLMEVYIRQSLEEKNQIAVNTIQFIDRQLSEMSDSLKRSEQILQNFRIKNKIIDLSEEGKLLFEKLKTLQEQKASYQLKQRYYNYLLEYQQGKENFKEIIAPSAMGIEDLQLTNLLNQINEAYIQREELLLTSKEGSIALSQTETRLENLKKTLIEKTNSIIDANSLMGQEVDKRMGDLENELLKLPLNERQLITIERNFNLQDKLYTYLLEKRAEAAIAKASNIADNKVLDYALPDNATIIKPDKKVNYLFAILVGLFIPVIIILLMNYLNTTLRDLKEINKYTKTPILGSVGHNKFQSDLPVFDKPKSTLSESFRAIRTNLQYILNEPRKKVITVTSTVSGEGKTFIAANLAAIISLNQKKVLVLGLDLRKPKLQNYFGTNYPKGLSTYLIGRDPVEEVLFSTPYDNLFYIPAGPIPPNPAELIGSSKMKELINWSKEQFDYVIIDTPPIAIVTDALLTQKFSDMLLFVIRFNYSNKEVLRLVEGLRVAGEAPRISLVINDLHHRRLYGYSYGYNYGYSYGYSYSYGNTYGYTEEKDTGGYYTDDEPPLTWRERIKRLF